MIAKALSFALIGALLLGGCAQSEQYDEIYGQGVEMLGYADAAIDTPAGFVAAGWAETHEKPADELQLADLPEFGLSLTDPYNVLPPPFGTFYVPWKMTLTLVKTFPFVAFGGGEEEDDGTGTVAWASDLHHGPLWYVLGPSLGEMDRYVSPAKATVTASHTPVPGNGDRWAYWRSRINSIQHNFTHAGHTAKYVFLGTNSMLPPYDNFFPDQLERDKTTQMATWDWFLFNYDWDDPFIN